MSKMSRGPDGRPNAFHDLDPNAFPIELVGVDPDGGILWIRRISGPYEAVEIPGAPPHLEGKVSVRVKYGDGTVGWAGPRGKEAAEAYIEQRIKESQDAE